MSLHASAALQALLHARLSAALAGVSVLDAMPAAPPECFVLIGPDDIRDASDISGRGATHRLLISVIGGADGLHALKLIASEICTALETPLGPMAGAELVSLGFERARAYRLASGGGRRVDLTFRARLSLG